MNYNILSPSLGVTISLVLSSSILAVNRNDEVLFRDDMDELHGAERRKQQDRRRKVVKPVTPVMP